jgi:hypothetical protein
MIEQGTRRLTVAVGTAFCILTASVQAFMLPSVPTVEPEPLAPPAVAPDAAAIEPTPCPTPPPTPRPFSYRDLIANGVAVNFDYRYSNPKFRSTLLTDVVAPSGTVIAPSGTVLDSETKLHTETVRLEYVPFTFLSLYAIGARHDGKTGDTSLDGWGFGAGFTAAVAAQEPARERITGVEISPLVIYDFSYTYNDFEDVRGGQDIFNSTARIGGMLQHRKIPRHLGLTPYIGASYQVAEKVQGIRSPFESTVSISPDDTWTPVGGLVLSHLVEGRPNFSLIFEATTGDSEYYLVSLRYEYLPKRHPTP